MGCIKPPANVTPPQPPRGPTRLQRRSILGDPLSSATPPPGTGHVFTVEPYEKTFGGGHHMPEGAVVYVHETPIGLSAKDVVVDLKSGNSRVKPVLKDETGKEKSKKKQTIFNPQLTQEEVIAEINSVRENPDSERTTDTSTGRTTFDGISSSGARLKVVVESTGDLVTAYPELPHLTFKKKQS